MKTPDFFLIGAPKCATTSLSYYLSQHPEVFMAPRKEAHFFGSDLNASPRVFVKDRDRYLSMFSEAEEGQIAGEASVYYLFSRKAASEIQEFNPKAKAIAILRNPIEVVRSLHAMRVRNRLEDILTLEAAIDAEEERKLGRGIPETERVLGGFIYTSMAKFSGQIDRYLKVFGRDRVLILIFDDLASYPEKTFSQVCRFLDVDPGFAPRFEVKNKGHKYRSRLADSFARKLFPTDLIRKIPPSLRNLAVGIYTAVNVVEKKPETISPSLRSRLAEEFEEDVERLSMILDRDLTYWLKEPGVVDTRALIVGESSDG